MGSSGGQPIPLALARMCMAADGAHVPDCHVDRNSGRAVLDVHLDAQLMAE